MTGWPPKDWRALLALVFSIAGAVVLTAFLWWLCAALLPGGGAEGWSPGSEGSRALTLRWVAWIIAGSIGLVLLGLGFAINRRSLTAKWGNKELDWHGGEGETTPEQAAKKVKEDVEQAAEQSVKEIAAAAPDDPPGGA